MSARSESFEFQIGFSSQDICIQVEYKIKEKTKYFEYKIKSFKFINVNNYDEIDFLLAELVNLKNEQDRDLDHKDLIYYYVCLLLGNLTDKNSKENKSSEKLISILADSLSNRFVSNRNLYSAVVLIQETVLSEYIYLFYRETNFFN